MKVGKRPTKHIKHSVDTKDKRLFPPNRAALFCSLLMRGSKWRRNPNHHWGRVGLEG